MIDGEANRESVFIGRIMDMYNYLHNTEYVILNWGSEWILCRK